jgi:hypothetical protein
MIGPSLFTLIALMGEVVHELGQCRVALLLLSNSIILHLN